MAKPKASRASSAAPPHTRAAFVLDIARAPVDVRVQRADAAAGQAELLVVDAYEGVTRFGGVTAQVDEACGGLLSRVVAAGDFKGKFKEMALVHPPDGKPATRVLLVGMGKLEKLSPDRVRRVAAVVARRAKEIGVREMRTVLLGARDSDAKGLKPRVAGEAIAEGALLGLYAFEFYKGKREESDEEKEKPKLARITIVEKRAGTARDAERGAQEGAIIAEATNLCRDWGGFSGEEAAPERYGARSELLARTHGLKVEVMDKAAIRALGMGGLLAVNSGSAREPRFVILSHEPRGAKGTVVLVGKGITFDSGGISIKPSDHMEDMKFDKCGAAAVAGAVVAAKRLKIPLKVIGIMAFTENLPSGTAYKPGDIVRTMSGKTIEVINTDAEGRVILADALHYGGRYHPHAMVELSTLTGGCPIAVGHHAIAGMGNSDELMTQLRAAGDAVNERVWPLPFFEEYGEMVKSKVADVKNSAGRVASSITAGKFLEAFVGDHPWIHLDIASTAWHEGPSPRLNDEFCPEPQTGVGVRLLVRWMRDFRRPKWTPKPKNDSGTPKAAKDKREREDARGHERISVS